MLDRDEDYSSEEEDDILYSDAWEGLKMRGSKHSYRPDSPDGNIPVFNLIPTPDLIKPIAFK